MRFKLLRAAMLLYMARIRGWEWYGRKIGVRIGYGCRIYKVGFGSEPFLISIGNRVTVTSGVRFITHDGSTWLVRGERGRHYFYAPIKIGDDVFIGVDSIILPGVQIGDRCIIGAGSVVTKSVPAGTVVAGVPARRICEFDEFEAKVRKLMPAEKDLPSRSNLDYKLWVGECIRQQDELRANQIASLEGGLT